MAKDELILDAINYIDPHKLVFKDENRKTDPRHIARLKAALSEDNQLHVRPIVVNAKLEIIDGQNRTMAARELGLQKIPCLVVKGASVESAPTINQNMKNWGGSDFAHYWAKKGKADYVQFNDFSARTGLPYSVAIVLLSGGNAKNSRHITNFKRGLFTIFRAKAGDYMRYVELFLQRLEDFKPYLKSSTHDTPFIMAFWRVFNNINYQHERMVHKLAVNGFTKRSTKDAYVEELEEVYNYKVKPEERIRFSE